NMRVTEQIDAISTMGVSPVQYLVVPRVVASVVMLPCLCMLFTMVGMAGAYGVAVGWLDVDPGIFWDRVRTFVEPADLWMGAGEGARGREVAIVAERTEVRARPPRRRKIDGDPRVELRHATDLRADEAPRVARVPGWMGEHRVQGEQDVDRSIGDGPGRVEI